MSEMTVAEPVMANVMRCDCPLSSDAKGNKAMILKSTSAVLLMLSLIGLCRPPHSHAQNDPVPAGMIDISGVTVSMVLPIYRDLCGAQLITSSEVKKLMTQITIGPAGPLK